MVLPPPLPPNNRSQKLSAGTARPHYWCLHCHPKAPKWVEGGLTSSDRHHERTHPDLEFKIKHKSFPPALPGRMQHLGGGPAGYY